MNAEIMDRYSFWYKNSSSCKVNKKCNIILLVLTVTSVPRNNTIDHEIFQMTHFHRSSYISLQFNDIISSLPFRNFQLTSSLKAD